MARYNKFKRLSIIYQQEEDQISQPMSQNINNQKIFQCLSNSPCQLFQSSELYYTKNQSKQKQPQNLKFNLHEVHQHVSKQLYKNKQLSQQSYKQHNFKHQSSQQKQFNNNTIINNRLSICKQALNVFQRQMSRCNPSFDESANLLKSILNCFDLKEPINLEASLSAPTLTVQKKEKKKKSRIPQDVKDQIYKLLQSGKLSINQIHKIHPNVSKSTINNLKGKVEACSMLKKRQ